MSEFDSFDENGDSNEKKKKPKKNDGIGAISGGVVTLPDSTMECKWCGNRFAFNSKNKKPICTFCGRVQNIMIL
ncbi:MAG: hypothetical protein LBP36_03410 [Oscillospiraceae bacterium]|jgi:hypothetical protein|nr:hypothetical protein [Oscillospiraceae bacterium]